MVPEGDPEPTSVCECRRSGADQCGLQDIEDEPAKENDSMDVEQSGRGRAGWISVCRCPAETVGHDNCDEDRHREVKVFL